ncbi:flagellum biosynthesis protein FlbT [Paramagnetospirillum kuznetsovii]|uniref:Flagellum biosynthesis protein FlbT n=1 Tax=Paramagnetospirillum kuznetsovii TaxID=2053833 RepID=A0A364P1A2_9PROT|nr:flagellar biosynthesis repressor FlbT [Paramagnetospirillum kuznetsovii]RAU22895.1 flagellum biosynthesis protein FlbT [Paramagnetospirillum kuznetsovii]
MPLLIDLKPGEKVIVNGAVVENAGHSTKLRVLNDSNILREKDIIADGDSITPAGRVYFFVQNAYIFPGSRTKYLGLFERCLTDYVESCASAAPLGEELRAAVAAQEFYKALKLSRKLLKHEAQVLENFKISSAKA